MHNVYGKPAARGLWRLADIFAEFFAGEMSGGIVQGACPDRRTGLQVSTCSGYDLGHPG